MWFPSVDELRGANEGSAFLLLAWNELFAADTPDSFQPKLMNCPSLLEELRLIAERASRSPRWEKHVRKIQEELGSVCEADQNFLDAAPRLRWSLQKLCEKGNLSEVVSVARILGPNLQDYELQVNRMLLASVADLPKAKGTVLSALRRLATIALRKGRSEEDFSFLMRPEYLNRTPEEILNLIIRAINAPSKEYLCILAVKGKPEELQAVARKAGFQLQSQRDIPVQADGEQFLEVTKGAVWLSMHVQASKPLEAARLAVRRLRPALDIFNFYQHDALAFFDEVLVLTGGTEPTLVKPQKQWLWQVRRSRDARKLTKELLASASEERLVGQVLNALEHYSVAQTSTISRVKLANLWSALECLAAGDTAESVIASVCETIAPAVAWRRTGKILSYTAKSLHEFRSVAGGSLGAGFPVEEGGLPSERLLLALARPEGHPAPEDLQQFVATHPLLRFRVFSLWKTFSVPKDLAAELKLSRKRIEWHLYRIYRARNLLVHEGQEVADVPHLLENLHYYFCAALSRVLHGMNLNPAWDVPDSIVHWRMRYEYTVSSLESRPQILQVSDLLPMPRQALYHTLIWPPAAA
jgi:hypothetical protein